MAKRIDGRANNHGTNTFDKMDPEKLKAAQQKGHQKRRENVQLRKTLKEELLLLLSNGDIQERMSLVLIDKVLNNDKDAVRAYEVIRDTIGEKATEKVEAVVENREIKVSIEDDESST